MKKGQIEMLGLVIVLVLILIGALFYVRFGVLDVAEKREESTIKLTQAGHLLNALLPISVCEQSFKQAVASCKEGKTLCNKEACTALKEELPSIIDPLLHTQVGTAYTFEAKQGQDVFLTFGECTTGTNSPPYRFNQEGKAYQVYFKLCPLKEA